MLLGAGYGTRLRPLTDELPKPLVPIGDRSVAAHISRRLADAGYQRAIVNAHHLPERWADVELALPYALIVESGAILGTAGGVANAADLLGPGEICVHAGDIVSDVDFAALRALHHDRAPFVTMAVVGGRGVGEGSVGVGASGEVVRLRHGRFGEEIAGADFVGVQMLSQAARDGLPASGCLVGDVYIPALERGAAVIAAPVATRFDDIGTIASYLAANLQWLERHGFARFSAPDADVEVALDRSIVGAGARVRGQGALRRCVVWPGATAIAPLEDAIVTPRTVVQKDG